MQTILVTGGTGLIGSTLLPFLVDKGYHCIVLTRDKEDKKQQPGVEYANWDVKRHEIQAGVVERADYIIHLAGAGVVDKKWTKEYKQVIIDSRTQSSKLLVDTLAKTKNEVKAIISASAIGWYGPDKVAGKAFTEDDPAANDFLGTTCKLWEESIREAEKQNIRVCTIRTGIVLDDKGGALAEFIKPLKLGVAGVLGSGKQMVSWVHVLDHCRLILHALTTNAMSGPYNSVAPNPVTNEELTRTLAHVKNGNAFFTMHVPKFVLKIMMGQRSEEVLKSTTVSATKIRATGFSFIYSSIKPALENLCG